jgi:outer membrane murein-binding lipoprotein Lpp
MKARVVASIITLLLLAGCNSAAKEKDKMSEAFAELMKRPDITQVQADYQSMFETIRERLVAEVGVAQWVPHRLPISGAGCDAGFSHLDGETRSMDAGMSPGNLSDAKWDQAVAIVTEVAGKRGFGAPKVIVSKPNSHEVSFRDPYNGELLFGSGGNTVLAVSTGCHLTQEAHQRGTYQPPKQY